MGVLRGLFVRKDATKGTGPRDARMALAGLLVPSSTIGARAGVLAGPGNPGTVTGTAGWQYSVSGSQVVASRTDSQGPVLFALDGPTLTAAVQPAPASGARWDLIYVQHHDIDQGDADSAASVGVVSGAAAGSPVKPVDVPAGALVLAEALVSAGATSTQHANVTITRVTPWTTTRGGVLPVRSTAERTALAAYEGMLIARLDTGNVERYHQGAWGPPSDLAALRDSWRPYTPAISTSGIVLAIGNGSLQGWYRDVGKQRQGRIEFVRGSTTNVGNAYYQFTYPSTGMDSSRWKINGCGFYTRGGNERILSVRGNGIGTFALVGPSGGRIGHNTEAWAAGDEFVFEFTATLA